MFERAHHQRIAQVLAVLDAELLRQCKCLFGGGTVFALRHGEYRESVDMDFLVSDTQGYRQLRQLLTGPDGLASITRGGMEPPTSGEVRGDQYGIRTALRVDGEPIKFEIVLEARMALQDPGPADKICGIATLTPLDMAASKLLANCDRWADDGVFSRDLIDLAQMGPALPLLRRAVEKAKLAYGESVLRDLGKALGRLQERQGWLDRCMSAMKMETPKAVLWQKLRALGRVLPKGSASP